ncbi:MAG: hypothetical protein IJ708_12615 [Clostridia bacterium]|nr:hypothetical protein [Clostridia bacterium]
MVARFQKLTESFLESVEYGYSYIDGQQEELRNESEEALDARYEAEDALEAYKAEMRFLARTLIALDVDIPLEGHKINFGNFLPPDDPRRDAFSYEVDV